MRSVSCLGCSGLILSVILVSSAGCSSAAERTISEEEIIAALPKGSVIAQVPTRVGEDGKVLKTKTAIVSAQSITQEQKQVMIGYYTEPDPKEGESPSDSFYSRAHVALLAREKGKVRIIWDPGGWGFAFGFKRCSRPLKDEQVSLFFDVRDINGDGKPELLFARSASGTEGSSFEIWVYDSKATTMKRICAADGSIRFLRDKAGSWPKVLSESFHSSTYYSTTFEYNTVDKRYERVKDNTK